MMIRGSRKWLIKQLDTPLIQENLVEVRRRDAHQIGPRVMVFDADRVFTHGVRFVAPDCSSETLLDALILKHFTWFGLVELRNCAPGTTFVRKESVMETEIRMRKARQGPQSSQRGEGRRGPQGSQSWQPESQA